MSAPLSERHPRASVGTPTKAGAGRPVRLRSLEPTEAKKVGDRWGDGAALELAILHNVSRFRDPGRGQGLAGIRRYLGRWQGKLSVRSGTARLAVVPDWDDDDPLSEHLPFFPGSQVQITIPAQEAVTR